MIKDNILKSDGRTMTVTRGSSGTLQVDRHLDGDELGTGLGAGRWQRNVSRHALTGVSCICKVSTYERSRKPLSDRPVSALACVVCGGWVPGLALESYHELNVRAGLEAQTPTLTNAALDAMAEEVAALIAAKVAARLAEQTQSVAETKKTKEVKS